MLGAVATQWARTATNPDEIKTWFMAKMGFPMNIITGDQEGAYGYAAATHDQLDRIILDAGGGSFQLTYWPTGEAKPTAASLRFGHDESSAKVWTKPDIHRVRPRPPGLHRRAEEADRRHARPPPPPSPG